MMFVCCSYDDVKKELDANGSYSDQFQTKEEKMKIKEETLEIRDVKMEVKEENMEVNMFAETKQEGLQIKKEIKQENLNYTKGGLIFLGISNSTAHIRPVALGT